MGSDVITLPGSIPDLLRQGSPILYRGCGGTVLHAESGGGCCHIGHVTSIYGTWTTAEPKKADLLLVLADVLTNPTGMAHATWWLAWKLGLEGHNQATLALCHDFDTRHIALLEAPGSIGCFFASESAPSMGASDLVVPSLKNPIEKGPGHLSEKGLKDWEEAEILRRIVLHVAGPEFSPPCSKCEGEGRYYADRSDAFATELVDPCPYCNGTGQEEY